jgi:hypothetical protein
MLIHGINMDSGSLPVCIRTQALASIPVSVSTPCPPPMSGDVQLWVKMPESKAVGDKMWRMAPAEAS